MARRRIPALRFDFRGGVNTAFSEDLVDHTELRSAKNVRLGLEGGIVKRLGTQALMSTGIGASEVNHLFQWDSPDIHTVLARVTGDANLYEFAPSTGSGALISAGWSVGTPVGFAQHRVGVNIYVYIADMTKGVVQWDGATETPIATAPSAANGLEVYKERMFAIDGTKTIFWSAPTDPTLWDLGNDGGFTDIETYDTEPIVAILTLGSSLVIFKRNNIARWTGHDTTNIKIDRETEGISSEIGLIGPEAWCKVEEFAFFLSDRGAYIANESGIQEVGQKVEDAFKNRTLSDALCVHHRGRREVWVRLPTYNETWVWCYRTGAWSGPWDLAFTAAALYERSTGAESVMLGSGVNAYDGDIGQLDGVTYAGTGGTNIEYWPILPVLHFGVPHVKKFMRRTQNIEADIPDGAVLTVLWSSEFGQGQSTIIGKGGGVQDYRFRMRAAGRRLTLELHEDGPGSVSVHGLILEASVGGRTR